MPTLTLNKNLFLEKIGEKLSDEQLEKILPLIKLEVEEIGEDEIKVEVTPDRPDMFFLDGIARTLKCFLGKESGIYQTIFDVPKIEVKIEKVEARPYFACFIVRNVFLDNEKIKELMQIQELLNLTLGRKRERVAIGFHDFDKMEPPITYKEALPTEKFVPLNYDTEMTLKQTLELTDKGRKFGHLIANYKNYPAIYDQKGIFSFPPILNSNRTKITENTKNIFVDITGKSKRRVEEVAKILAYYFSFFGKLEKVKIVVDGKKNEYPNFENQEMTFESKLVEKYLGVRLTSEEIKNILERMGYDCLILGEKITAIAPFYRVDILHVVDVIEDIAIGYGLNNFEPILPSFFTYGEIDENEKKILKLKELLVGIGLIEVITPVFTNYKKHFENLNLEKEKVVEVENPVSEEYTILRKWIFPGLIYFLSKNTHYEYPQKIFEIGYVIEIDENAETKTKNPYHLAIAIADPKTNLSEIKGILDFILQSMGRSVEVEELKMNCFIEGRAGKIILNGKEIGFFGEINPLILERYGFWVPITVLEISLEELL